MSNVTGAVLDNAVQSATGHGSSEAINLVDDATLAGRIKELERQRKADGKLSPELGTELRSLQALRNGRDQIRRRDEARDSVKVYRDIRLNPAARKLLNTMFKEEMGMAMKDDPELKGKSAVQQIHAVASNAASEDGLKRLEATFDKIRNAVKAAPGLATREVMFEGNVPAIDVLLSTVGIRPSTKAVDRDIDAAIGFELREEATPEGQAS